MKLVTIAGDTFLAFTLQTEGRTSAAANGIATWVSILGSRTLCREITTQVGTTYPLWLTMESRGEAVTLKLSHEAPVDDPMAEPPEVFTGTRRGDSITASSQGPMGGLACPTDTSITPQVGGDLEADIAGDRITGRYTETYGTSDEQVTFVFRFEASL